MSLQQAYNVSRNSDLRISVNADLDSDYTLKKSGITVISYVMSLLWLGLKHFRHALTQRF